VTSRPELHALASYCGILPRFVDWRGAPRDTTDDAREALLASMCIDATTEEGAQRALDELRTHDRAAPGVGILRASDRILQGRISAVGVADGEHACDLLLRDLRGEVGRARSVARVEHGVARVAVPADIDVSPGYYDAELRLGEAAAGTTLEWFVLAPPARCVSVAQRCGRERALGVMLNLYAVRSAESWGIGDLSDVARVSARVVARGARFVGLSPIHATANRGSGISPYYPSSRLFFNWIYLDVDAVPEMAGSAEARALVDSREVRSALARLRAAERVDHNEIAALKLRVLAALHREFRRLDAGSPRRLAYLEYCRRKGEDLEAHATYDCLAETLAPSGPEEPDWRRWPSAYRDRDSRETLELARANTDRVDLHRWLQFELDRQLATADAGLGLGLFCDLAVGAAPGGAEVWADRAAFADAVVLGAPPDDYSDEGQSWGVAPLLPRRLRASRYRHLRRLLSANLRHAGALRIDHAMGLVRQFWVPEGRTAAHGAYVAFPAEEMFAVLAIESMRAGAVVVAEDLGTVPEGFREDLVRRGCLRTQVVYFEREDSGEFRSPDAYAAEALATINTHDLPPLRGYWSGIDLRLRAAAGALDRGISLEDALARREQEKAALARRLESDGAPIDGDGPSLGLSLCRAGALMLAASPAALVAVGLDDLGEEEIPVNVPGLVSAQLPLWARRMRRDAIAILDTPTVVALLEDTAARMDASVSGVEVPIDGCLDLHTFRPSDIGTLIPDYLTECRKRGIRQVRIVHGKGRGDLRRGVEAVLARAPGVAAWRAAHGDEGAWGATVVTLSLDDDSRA
jgi:4-alpha-glucanotransferase